jgi:hypothetical protein
VNDVTPLSRWRIDAAEQLAIELIRPSGLNALSRTVNPSIVRIVWPTTPTEFQPQHFANAAAIACQVFASASIELTRLQAVKKWNR